ncbi:MAG TPA: PA14 domain-containing protein, partial [Planctomycetota bacterium]|nr:PA14 domain-containing protein [Planctomycetota bacterium]
PKKGRIQLQCPDADAGLRILAVESRPLPPAFPPRPVLKEGSVISVTPSLSRGMALRWWADGDYITEEAHGMICYSLMPNPHSPNRYLYAVVHDRPPVTARVDALVDYFDEGSGEFGLEYDSLQNSYRPAYQAVRMEGSGVWKTAQFILEYPVFRGRQNARSDLRLVRAPGAPLRIRGISLQYHKIEASGLLEGPVALPSEALPGVQFEYFEGEWERIFQFQGLKPIQVGTSDSIDLVRKSRAENFALRFTGYLKIPKDGVYTFSTLSDDGSTLVLGGRLIVENDGLHGTEEQSGSEELRAGFYALRVNYFQAKGGAHLEVFWSGPGFSKQVIPASSLVHVESRK